MSERNPIPLILTAIGSVAGKKMKIDLPKVEFTAEDQDSPEEGTEKWSATGVALASATAGADECTILFD